MKKQRTQILIPNLCWGAFFVALVFLVVMPCALGQRGQQAFSKKFSQVKEPSKMDGGTWTMNES